MEGKTDEKTGGLPDPRFHMELWKSVPLCLFVLFFSFLISVEANCWDSHGPVSNQMASFKFQVNSWFSQSGITV